MRFQNEVFQWVDSHSEEAVDLLKDLIRIPSVNPYFKDEVRLQKEGRIQEYLKNYIEQLGFETELTYPDAQKLIQYKDKAGYMADHTFADRPNLYGVLKGTGKGKSIFLSGHTDVVATGTKWTHSPYEAEQDGDCIYGRGSVDMKGGIAAMVFAVKAILECGAHLAGDVKIGTVVDEESGGMGTLALMAEGYRADACLLTEPTSLNMAPLCRGILWGKIIVEGQAGHIELQRQDWRKGGAVDAIDKAAYILDYFDQLNKEWEVTKVHKYLPIPCQVKFAQFDAGEYPTTFANRAELTFDAQYLPKEKDVDGLGGNVKKEIEKFVFDVAQTDPWLKENVPKVEWILDADCGETSDKEEFFHVFSNAVRQVVPTSQIIGNPAHVDMGWFCNVGIPTFIFGPGNPMQCHQADEHIKKSEFIEAVKAIASTVMDWCGTDE